jgi:hypothetical protein
MSDPARPGDRESEVLDVELLDVLAQVEALLRLGREVQREALRVRGVPHAVTSAQRQAAGAEIQRYVREMKKECRALGEVLRDLQAAADTLAKVLNADTQDAAAIEKTRGAERSLAADRPKRPQDDI